MMKQRDFDEIDYSEGMNSDDEEMKDINEDDMVPQTYKSEKEQLEAERRQQELEEAAQYYEPIDPSQEGVYFVKAFDANTEKWRWKVDLEKLQGVSKEYSPTLVMKSNPEHRFRLLFFPRGNNVNHISCYLDTAGTTEYKLVRFQVSLLNVRDIRESVSQGMY